MTLKGRIITAAAITGTAALFILMMTVMFGIGMKILYPVKYGEIIEKYSAGYGVDKALLLAVIRTESSFDPEAVSQADAVGLTQITPETREWISMRLGEDDASADLTDPETSVKYGAYLLSYLTERFGDRNTVLAAYHAGMGRVSGWLEDESISPDGRTLSVIPIKETAHYIEKVNKAFNAYSKLYK